MKTILTTIAVLALTFTSCKKNTIAPATQPTSSNAKQDSLYRDIFMDIRGDSAEIWINDVKFQNNTFIIYPDTLQLYIGTQLFYKGDIIKIRVAKTKYFNEPSYPNGYSSIDFTQYYNNNLSTPMSVTPQQVSTNAITVFTFTVK